MMSKRIIYKNDAGGVSIIAPSVWALSLYGIDSVAMKDVPAGKPYKIVDVSDIPEDRTFRAAWEVDESELIDGFGADSSAFQEQSE